jgi:hypothetical protein
LISILNLFYILRGLEGGPERGPDGGPERGPDEGVQLLYPPLDYTIFPKNVNNVIKCITKAYLSPNITSAPFKISFS